MAFGCFRSENASSAFLNGVKENKEGFDSIDHEDSDVSIGTTNQRRAKRRTFVALSSAFFSLVHEVDAFDTTQFSFRATSSVFTASVSGQFDFWSYAATVRLRHAASSFHARGDERIHLWRRNPLDVDPFHRASVDEVATCLLNALAGDGYQNVPGKELLVPDVLSRALPRDQPDHSELCDVEVHAVELQHNLISEPTMARLVRETALDPNLAVLINCLKEGPYKWRDHTSHMLGS